MSRPTAAVLLAGACVLGAPALAFGETEPDLSSVVVTMAYRFRKRTSRSMEVMGLDPQ